MKVLRVLDSLIVFFEKYVTIFLMGFTFFLLLLQVFTRYIIHNPLSWPEELIRFCFVSMIYLAISYAASQDAHIRIEMHLKILPLVWQTVVLSIGDLVWITYNLVIIKEGIGLIQSLFRYTYISPVLRVSMAYVYIIIPFAFTLMTIRIIQHFCLRIQRTRKTYQRG